MSLRTDKTNPMRRTTSAFATSALICGLMVANPLLASAAEFDPDDIAELRVAVTTANGTEEADTITLRAGATYTLTDGGAGENANATGDLDVLGDLTIDGNGATLNAAGLDRFFDVFGASLTLIDVTIVNGDVPDAENGGGVRGDADSTIVVSGGSIEDSAAVNAGAGAATAGSGGAIASAGDLVVDGTSFSGNAVSRAGGAIELSAGASADISDATFADNATAAAPGNGGALHITGAASATVDGSTFTGNTAAEGGALWNSAAGTLTVTDSTLADNTANGAAADQGGGAVFTEGGDVAISGSMLNDNQATGTAGSGGAIQNINGAVTVTRSTIDGNTAQRAGGGIEAGPLLTTTAPAVTGSTAPTSTVLDDVTLTDNSLLGTPRDGGGLHITGAGTVDVTGSRVLNNSAAEGGGLWNSQAGAMTVTNTTISGNTADGALADQGGGGIFTEGGDVTVGGGTITANRATGAAGSGGGILNIRGNVTVETVDIERNTAIRAGGGIEAGPILLDGAPDPASPETSTTLTNVTLAQNTTGRELGSTAGAAPGNGGGLHLTGSGTVGVIGSIVADNTAVEGGGLWISGAGTLVLEGSEVVENTATGDGADQGGGGVYSDGGSVAVSGSFVAENAATGAAGSGGGFLNVGGDLVVVDSAIVTNSAVRAGGGVEAAPLTGVDDSRTTTLLSGVDLAANTVTGPPGNGGGLHLTGAGDVAVDTSMVSGNTAVEGGGLWNSAAGSTVVTNSTISDNTSTGPDGGGGLYNDGGTLGAFNVTVTGNQASGAGGGLLSVGGSVSVVHGTVTDNSSGISGAVEIANTILTGNEDADAADGVTSLGGNVLDEELAFSADRVAGDDDTTGVSDPQLGELDDNGGPTPTRLPQDDSAAIDAGVQITVDAMGDDLAEAVARELIDNDQRGFDRPVDGDDDGSARVDSGAVELGAVADEDDGDDNGDGGDNGGGVGNGNDNGGGGDHGDGDGDGGGVGDDNGGDNNGGGGNGGVVSYPTSQPATAVSAQPNYTG